MTLTWRKWLAFLAGTVLLVAACLLPVGPTFGTGQLRWLGLACLALAALVGGLALLALGRDTRVHPIPAQAAELHTRGIYGVIRHPMYATDILLRVGYLVSHLSWTTGVLFALSTFCHS